MEIGIQLCGRIDCESQAAIFKKIGINRTFIGSEHPDFDKTMECLKKNDIICETLHAPFDKINDMWKADEAGEKMLERLIDGVDKCAKYDIPVLVVHISSGCPMPEMNETGIKRFEKLVEYANEKNIIIAFENQRYMENLQYMMKNHPKAGFCWDNGHESCFTPGMHFMPHFGDRLVALHIHDNCGEYNADNHVLPFDGKINFEEVAKYIAQSGKNVTVMLETSRFSKYYGESIYEKLTDEEFFVKAAAAARRLADMIEDYR